MDGPCVLLLVLQMSRKNTCKVISAVEVENYFFKFFKLLSLNWKNTIRCLQSQIANLFLFLKVCAQQTQTPPLFIVAFNYLSKVCYFVCYLSHSWTIKRRTEFCRTTHCIAQLVLKFLQTQNLFAIAPPFNIASLNTVLKTDT